LGQLLIQIGYLNQSVFTAGCFASLALLCKRFNIDRIKYCYIMEEKKIHLMNGKVSGILRDQVKYIF
jgi:hypothetical protein